MPYQIIKYENISLKPRVGASRPRERPNDRRIFSFGSLWWSPLGVLYVNIKVDNSTKLCGKSPKKERETFTKLSRL